MERRAASVLLGQFETVAYTNTDLLASFETHSPDDVDATSELGLPVLELIGRLKAFGPNVSTDVAKSYSAVLAGAKNFVPPN